MMSSIEVHAMRVVCHYCQKQYSLRDENVGDHFRCRACGKLSPVSPADAAQPAETRSAPALRRPTMTQTASRNPASGRPSAAPTANVRPAAARPATHNMHGAPPAEPVGERWPIDCQFCGRRHAVRAEMAGMQFCCKGCGKLNLVSPPKPASDAQDDVLVATPIAPRLTLPTAQVVYVDDNDAPAADPGDDLFGEQQTVPMSAAPLVGMPLAPPPPPPNRRKKRKKKQLDSREYVLTVAFYLRTVLRRFLFIILLGIIGALIPMPNGVVLLLIKLIFSIISLIASILLIYYYFLLARNVHAGVMGLFFGLMIFVPGPNIFVVLWLVIRATYIVWRNGYHIGILGADD
jgi:hypothetical protein